VQGAHEGGIVLGDHDELRADRANLVGAVALGDPCGDLRQQAVERGHIYGHTDDEQPLCTRTLCAQ